MYFASWFSFFSHFHFQWAKMRKIVFLLCLLLRLCHWFWRRDTCTHPIYGYDAAAIALTQFISFLSIVVCKKVVARLRDCTIKASFITTFAMILLHLTFIENGKQKITSQFFLFNPFIYHAHSQLKTHPKWT